jgi:PHD/YefM family antitoxin component YafN of YafNO toxin-antitoxin module
MKKIIIVILLLISGGLITGFEINQIKAAKMDERVPIVVLKESLEVGVVLSSENLEIMEIQEAFATENTYRHIDDVLGKTLAIGLTKGTILSMNMITEQMFFTPAKGHSITAIALKPESIMCWEVMDGEVVDLVHVSLEGQLRRIGKVIIKGYYDQEMGHNYNFETVPTFVLVEGETQVIEEIIRSRDNGRIEVTKSR